ncbi:hypothetical protein NQZ68_013790 [Dissostichus eleginoides]|nr:hypothetical protein NQZ68_013790 [Dissostichus eleginoides]
MFWTRASISSLSTDSASDQPQEPIKRRRTLGSGEQQRLVWYFVDMKVDGGRWEQDNNRGWIQR